MRSGIILAVAVICLLGTSQAYGQKDTCQPRMYYNPTTPSTVFLSAMPTPWFAVRMSTNWVSEVDSAYFGFGIHRPVASTKRDTLEVRVLGNTLPSFTILDQAVFILIPNINGLFPDGYYIAEFRFNAPVAYISPPGDFWLSWRIKGMATDQARIMVKKPAIEPLRSNIINTNGSTVLATDFMRTQLSLSSTDSVDFMAEARLCYPLGTPVELVSLQAVWQNDEVVLKWETATEVNNYGFEILRATPSDQENIRLWERIGFVRGNGTTTQPNTYSFVDPYAEAAADKDGVTRYRLRQIDVDGSAEMTHVVEAHRPSAVAGFHLFQNYPNPVTLGDGSTVFSFALPYEQQARLEIYDALGRLVSVPIDGTLSAGRQSIDISMKNLRPGAYFYRLNAHSGILSRRMIITD